MKVQSSRRLRSDLDDAVQARLDRERSPEELLRRIADLERRVGLLSSALHDAYWLIRILVERSGIELPERKT